MDQEQKGKCIIFSAPSGAGKTTIVKHLLSVEKRLEFSISACSRAPRNVEGLKQKIAENAFVEWEEVYTDNFYGTLKSEIARIWATEKSVVFDVDVIGGLNLKKQFGDQALSVFVQPPSIEELEVRLRTRSTESEDRIQVRMGKARQELAHADEFDVVLLNVHLDQACKEAEAIVAKFLNA